MHLVREHTIAAHAEKRGCLAAVMTSHTRSRRGRTPSPHRFLLSFLPLVLLALFQPTAAHTQRPHQHQHRLSRALHHGPNTSTMFTLGRGQSSPATSALSAGSPQVLRRRRSRVPPLPLSLLKTLPSSIPTPANRTAQERRELRATLNQVLKTTSMASCFATLPTESMGKGKLPGWQKFRLCGLYDKTRGKLKVTISSASQGVAWKGWGTTLGETATYMGELERPEANCMGDLLYSSKYLGLNMIRYQIPGGYHPRFSPRMKENPHNSRGFWPKADNMNFFNASADTPQVRLLRLAIMKGVDFLEAISYSPPWWMTRTRMVEGAAKKGESNLRPAYGMRYARYLRTVIDFLEKEYNFQFYAVAPFNEPLEGWWVNKTVKLSAHEGCNFNVEEINEQMDNVRSWLGWKRRISGIDSWVRSVSSVLPRPWEGVDEGALRWRKFNQFDVHGYRLKENSTPRDDYCSLCGLSAQARRLNMSLWQSEWGPLGIKGASDLELALLMSRKIIQHVNLLGVEAWFHWQVISRVNPFWGIVRLHFRDDPNKVWLTKSYYAFRHFSVFMTKGSIPISVNQRCGHTILAISRPFIGNLIVFFVNQRGAPRRFSLNLKGFECTRDCLAQSFVTDDTRNFQHLDWPDNSLQDINVPENSLVTVVISGVSGWPVRTRKNGNPYCSASWMKKQRCPLAPR